MVNTKAERELLDRLGRLAAAHTRLADAMSGPAKSLHAAIASAVAEPLNARGAFFLAQRGALLEYGRDDRGEMIERSVPSALDIVPWATGGADGSAPFGYITGHWATLWVRAGDVVVGGVVVFDLTEPPDESRRAELEAIAAHAGALLRARAAIDEAERLSTTDALTGAKSRQVLMEALQAACDARDDYVVVFIDFDGLKEINDRDGHAAGDELIKRGAKALTHAVRSDEMVARIGGDEFVALVRAQPDDAKHIALRLTNALAAADVAASIGAVPAVDDAATALRLADNLMYAEKARKRQRGSLRVLPR